MIRRLIYVSTGILLAAALSQNSGLLAQDGTRSRTDTAEQGPSQARMLEDRIYNRLASSGSLAGSDIQVTVKGQTATLQGTVASDQAKQRAARIVQRAGGVQEVVNNLTVKQASADAQRNMNIGDDELSKKIADQLVSRFFSGARVERDWAFGWEVEGNGWEFEIDVDGGDVTLSGDVPRIGMISDVIRATRAVPGVRTVTSRLTVDDMFYRPYGIYPYSGYHPYSALY